MDAACRQTELLADAYNAYELQSEVWNSPNALHGQEDKGDRRAATSLVKCKKRRRSRYSAKNQQSSNQLSGF